MMTKTTDHEEEPRRESLRFHAPLSGLQRPRSRIRRKLIIALVCVAVAAVVTIAIRPMRPWRLVSYNLQNLFDATPDGGEFAAYRPQAGYDARGYWARLDTFSSVIRRIGVRETDVLVFLEVEHVGVVRDLTGDLLPGHWHTVSGARPQLGTQVVVASRSEPREVRAHAATVVRATAGESMTLWRSRDALAVELLRGPSGSDPFLIYAAHWKSQRGNAARSAGFRALEARLASAVIAASGSPSMLVGDLNEDPLAGDLDDSLRVLVPETAQESIGQGRPAQRFGLRFQGAEATPWPAGKFIWLWETDSGPGSYFFQNSWRRLDHAFLYLPQDGVAGGQSTARLQVVQDARLTDAHGAPHRYDPRTGQGVSDHLPLIVTLARRRIR